MGGALQPLGILSAAEQEAQAAEARGRYQRQAAEFNARLAEIQAEDAINRGDDEANRYREQVNQVIGRQRAAMAAQGISLDTGSAFEIQEQTMRQRDVEVLTIKNNAWREAWGFEVAAAQATAEGRFAEVAARNVASGARTAGILKAGESIQSSASKAAAGAGG